MNAFADLEIDRPGFVSEMVSRQQSFLDGKPSYIKLAM